ncbi:Membrane protein [Plasmodium coatneyi]|uniref:Membrane protein n=1 Tax=Plasmodium coatneyi TaxID=208452 RepID=A0A1B1E1T6_9APIC|nr:Membrane protein [Plasmodium coatneyi]ANQ08885.1 Membrane protein [Plasmodium coatneyi]
MRVGHFSFVRLFLLLSLLVQRLPVQKQQQSSIPPWRYPDEGDDHQPRNAFAHVSNQMKGTCDFSTAPLNVSSSENDIVPLLGGGDAPLGDAPLNGDRPDERVQHCVQFTKGMEVLTFVCPKRNTEDYVGVEVRPMDCFETVRMPNGNSKKLSNVLKGVQLENRDTDLLSIRKVFIPPTIYRNVIFECTCDNSLTFWNNRMGARGIMRVHLRKNILFGCDFDHTVGEESLEDVTNALPVGGDATGGASADWSFWRNFGPTAEELAEKNKTAFSQFYTEGEVKDAKEKGIVCNVKITKREVYLGLVCPPGYEMYPSNCFERVLYKDSIVRMSELIKHHATFHVDSNRRMSFATFTLNRNENPAGFTCLCVRVDVPEAPPLQANFVYNNYESFGFHFGLLYWLVVLLLLIHTSSYNSMQFPVMRVVKASLWGQLLVWWLTTPVDGFTHTCDFNDELTLEFDDQQMANRERICTLKPDVLDKVVIKCGSEKNKYELLPNNCFEQVYTSKSMRNAQHLVQYLHGAAAIVKRKQNQYNNSRERRNYDDVFFRVPPNMDNERKAVYCLCQNKAKIRVRKKSGHIYDKDIFNTGIVEVVIPTLPQRIIGCDFTENTSPLFTKGYDVNFYKKVENNENEDDVICRVRATEGKFIGFKCPANYSIEPEECFLQGFNLSGKKEPLQTKVNLKELVMDHYNKVFYARVPDRIYQNMHFFCACVLEQKRLVAHFEFIATSGDGISMSEAGGMNVLQGRSAGTVATGMGFLLLLLSGVLYFML